MEEEVGPELCFPHLNLNTSCRRFLFPRGHILLIYTSMSFIALLTVMLNLLVIVTISHFRQLHTSTNVLLLSLAVADLLVGLLLMPIQLLITNGCWTLGGTTCGLFYYVSFVLTSASVGTMVLISLDRYVAICEPLSYPVRVTRRRVKAGVFACWSCSITYNAAILNVFLETPDVHNPCHGVCFYTADLVTGSVDILFTFMAPTAGIVILYMKVFVAAVSQARAMRSHAVALRRSVGVTAKRSERKAARTLGILVVVFLSCYTPYFYPALARLDAQSNASFFISSVWLLYCNSCMNPIIYALFYPWFRKSVKLIVTLQILQPDSCRTQIL